MSEQTDTDRHEGCETRHSRSENFGHTRRGYAVEFNIDGICACRTLTVENREVAQQFARQLESMEQTDSVEVVADV